MRGLICLLAFICAALAAAAASPKRIPSRIVGGSPTTVDQYPYMSSIQYQILGPGGYLMHVCGGSLITSWTVLSAAHCFYDMWAPQFHVRLGTSFATNGSASIHQVSSFILHEKYNDNTLDNDIAIIRLATPAVLSSTVAVARIPASNYNLPYGAVVTLIGWGALWTNGPSPEQLQQVDVNIINQQLCVERYAYLKAQPGFENYAEVTEGMVCAGILDVGGASHCTGDSGGPLAFQRDIIYGVTSWGFVCAHEFYPGVYVRVSHYSDWVVENGSV